MSFRHVKNPHMKNRVVTTAMAAVLLVEVPGELTTAADLPALGIAMQLGTTSSLVLLSQTLLPTISIQFQG